MEVAAELRPDVPMTIALIRRMHYRKFRGVGENWAIHAAHFLAFPTYDPLDPQYQFLNLMGAAVMVRVGVTTNVRSL